MHFFRRLGAIALVCLLAGAAFASTTVSGNLKDLTGTAIANRTFVRFTIRNCGGNQPRKVGTGVIVPSFYDLTPNASGVISGTLYDNSEIQCGTTTNTWYGVVIWRDGKPGAEVSYLLAAGAFNLNSGTPLSTSPSSSFSANAVITNPVGDQTVAQPANTRLITSGFDAGGGPSAPAQRGTSLPATCVIGDEYFKTNATAGSNKYGCTAPNTWTLLGSSAYINVVTACGLAGDGVTDDSAAAQACFNAYPGYFFFFPQTQANGSCSYKFNSTLYPGGSGAQNTSGTVIAGTGGGYAISNSDFGGTELCFATGITGFWLDNDGGILIRDLVLKGSDGTDRQASPTKINIPSGTNLPIFNRSISAIQRAANVLTVTITVVGTEGLTAQVGSTLKISGVVGDATMNGLCVVSTLITTATNPTTFTCAQNGANAGPFGAVGTVSLPSTGASTADGIRVCGNFHKIVNVTVAYFGRHGINAASGEGGCAVPFSDDLVVRDSMIVGNQGFGIFMRGGDSNAGLFSGNSIYYNSLWGAYDVSFLGNTWLANQASYNALGAASAGTPSTKNISTISRTLTSGSSQTSIVLSSADTNIKLGSCIVIAGVTDTSFNTAAGQCFFVNSYTDSTHYGYEQPGAPADASSSGGTSRMAKFTEALLAYGGDYGSYKIGTSASTWSQSFISNYSEGGQACKFGISVPVLYGNIVPMGCAPTGGDWLGVYNQLVSGLQNFGTNISNISNFKDASKTFYLQAGISTGSAQDFYIQYKDHAAADTWGIRVINAGAGASGNYFINRGNAASGQSRLAFWGPSTANGITRLDSESVGAVQINNSANSGTGGLLVASGGASPSTVATVDSAGLGTFNGGVKAGASGSTIADTREIFQTVHSCGTTTTCANTANGSNREIFGSVALSSASPSTATITGISPAFTSTSSYFCTATPVGTTAAIAASGIAVSNVSSSSFTLTGPNTVTTVINYHCIGN